MSEHQEDQTASSVGIPDEALPEDLVASEDNPLAEGLPPGETAEGLMDPADDQGKDENQGEGEDDGVQTGSAPQEQ